MTARPRKKLIIEARINEYMPRSANKNVPFTPAEIAEEAAKACEAGASIIHFHARNPNGSPSHDPEIYARAIESIRNSCDALVFPTLGQISNQDATSRLDHIEKNAKDKKTRPDFAPIDVGSTNIDRFDNVKCQFESDRNTYRNDTGQLIYFARRLPELGVRPQFVSWNIAFTRTFDALRQMGLVEEVPYFLFELTDHGILGGHPGTIKGLLAHLDFLPAGAVEWSVCTKVGNPIASSVAAIEAGGHVALGLGDYGWPELGTPNNGDVIAFIAGIARAMGRDIARPQDTREMLRMA